MVFNSYAAAAALLSLTRFGIEKRHPRNPNVSQENPVQEMKVEESIIIRPIEVDR